MTGEAAVKPYVTVTSGMRGYFAVLMHWHEDGFWEPMQTGDGSFKTRAGAVPEALAWASAEGLEYRGVKAMGDLRTGICPECGKAHGSLDDCRDYVLAPSPRINMHQVETIRAFSPTDALFPETDPRHPKNKNKKPAPMCSTRWARAGAQHYVVTVQRMCTSNEADFVSSWSAIVAEENLDTITLSDAAKVTAFDKDIATNIRPMTEAEIEAWREASRGE